MKRLILLIAILISVCNLQAQTIPNLESRNCSDIITLFDTTFEVYRKDTSSNGKILYSVILKWLYTSPDNVFPLELFGTYDEIKEWENNPTYIDEKGVKSYYGYNLHNYAYVFEVTPQKTFNVGGNYFDVYCLD